MLDAVSRLVVQFLPLVPKPILWRFSKRYIAGPRLEDAVDCVRHLNSLGCMGTIDILGEDILDPEEAKRSARRYCEVLETIRDEDLDSNVSVKLSAIGLRISPTLCEENLRSILLSARSLGNSLCIDMEDSSCTDDTLALYERARREFPKEVSVAVQACLRRTVADVTRLGGPASNFRLCKGIYIEPPPIAYQTRDLVRASYAYALEVLLRSGAYVGIATHDEAMVFTGLRLVHALALKPDQYEFQMLLGVEEALRGILVKAGHRMRVYVPFGARWRPYSLRRLKENPRIAGYVMEAFFAHDQ